MWHDFVTVSIENSFLCLLAWRCRQQLSIDIAYIYSRACMTYKRNFDVWWNSMMVIIMRLSNFFSFAHRRRDLMIKLLSSHSHRRRRRSVTLCGFISVYCFQGNSTSLCWLIIEIYTSAVLMMTHIIIKKIRSKRASYIGWGQGFGPKKYSFMISWF